VLQVFVLFPQLSIVTPCKLKPSWVLIEKPKTFLSLVCSLDETEPSSFTQASKNSEQVAIMTDEFNAFIANNTLELVPHL